jgi:hypothetical protein
MDPDSNETAATDKKVSRRWMLRNTVRVTAGVAAVATVNFRDAEAKLAETVSAPDHDPTTGVILDRDRHHHWDTV